jgi:hypothetical protein
VLEEANRLVHGDRQSGYGHPRDNHAATAELFNAYLRRKYEGTFPGLDARDVCVFNICQKLSRFANAPKRDNLVDIAGYAANLEMLEEVA